MSNNDLQNTNVRPTSPPIPPSNNKMRNNIVYIHGGGIIGACINMTIALILKRMALTVLPSEGIPILTIGNRIIRNDFEYAIFLSKRLGSGYIGGSYGGSILGDYIEGGEHKTL